MLAVNMIFTQRGILLRILNSGGDDPRNSFLNLTGYPPKSAQQRIPTEIEVGNTINENKPKKR